MVPIGTRDDPNSPSPEERCIERGGTWNGHACIQGNKPNCPNGTDAQGRCCPDGSSPGADGACHSPNEQRGNSGGGGGGGGSLTSRPTTQFKFTPIDFSQFMTPNWANVNQIRDWWTKDPRYMQALRNVTGLYNTFGVGGSGAYANAVNYNNAILQGGKGATAQALAPMYTNLADQTKVASQQLEGNAALRGGARDQAQQDLRNEAFRASQGFIQQAQPQAAAQLGQLGVAGGQLGATAAGMFGELAQAPITGSLTAEFQGRSLGATVAMANQQTALGYSQLNANLIMKADELALQKLLGEGSLALGQQDLDFRRQQAADANKWQQEQWDWYKNIYYPGQQQMYQQQQAAQRKAQDQQKWASLLGSTVNAGLGLLPGGSLLTGLKGLFGSRGRTPQMYPGVPIPQGPLYGS